MIRLPELEELTASYAALPMEPMRVIASLKQHSHLVAYDQMYLEGILAWCVVRLATGGRGVVDTPLPYWIPLPLDVAAWIDGMPLWRSSVFLAEDRAESDTVYHHKRIINARHSSNGNLKTNVGRWMERRVPVPTQVTPTNRYVAYAVGHIETVARLLDYIAFLGKRRNIGFGEVAQWTIEACPPNDVFVRDGALAHALPAAYEHDYPIDSAPTLVGWTPPAWKPSLQRLGWPVGTIAYGGRSAIVARHADGHQRGET